MPLNQQTPFFTPNYPTCFPKSKKRPSQKGTTYVYQTYDLNLKSFQTLIFFQVIFLQEVSQLLDSLFFSLWTWYTEFPWYNFS